MADLSEQVEELLRSYADGVADKLDQAAQTVIDEMIEETRAAAEGHGWKNIAKSIASYNPKESKKKPARIWHVKAPHYRLVHLLENGHLKRGGRGRTKAYKFIASAAEKAVAHFEKLAEEAING